MTLKFTLTLTLMLAVILSAGCTSSVRNTRPAQKSNLTAGMVKREIIKGKTTQADILELFGAPNLVTKNRDEDEVWNYHRMSADTASGSDSGWAIFWGGTQAVSSTSTSSFDLIIIFDEHDVINDYSLIQASY
ncbi:MAG: hypothetical protein KAY24_04165 [Candidatus Eisenbacteria sp.]|nr:hypothetical protein [Candidatus Eisenbacteria bacterium]